MAKTTSWIFGAILVIAGIWGFFTQPSPVAGFLAASVLSSIIHLVVGIVLLALAAKPAAGCTLKVVGILYVIFGILTFVSVIFPAGQVTAWFYIIVGVIVAALGFSTKKGAVVPPAAPSAPAAPAPQA